MDKVTVMRAAQGLRAAGWCGGWPTRRTDAPTAC